MDDSELADLADFLGEIQAETDRGLPLVAAAVLDEKLLEVLYEFMVEGKSRERLLTDRNAPLATLSARADACLALGLVDEFEHNEISLIRKIRNEFAHSRHGLTFADQRIEGLCASLKIALPSGVSLGPKPGRTRFLYSVVGVIMRLYYRGRHVRAHRRERKDWGEEDLRWREIRTEGLPPAGEFVIGIFGGELRIAKLLPSDAATPGA